MLYLGECHHPNASYDIHLLVEQLEGSMSTPKNIVLQNAMHGILNQIISLVEIQLLPQKFRSNLLVSILNYSPHASSSRIDFAYTNKIKKMMCIHETIALARLIIGHNLAQQFGNFVDLLDASLWTRQFHVDFSAWLSSSLGARSYP